MRTTVTLDPDTEQYVRELMERHGVSFKRALNDAIRVGIPQSSQAPPFRIPAVDLGHANVNLDKALQLAGELEDEEIINKMLRGA